jgi:hypothetical protein
MNFTRQVDGIAGEAETVSGSFKCNPFCCVRLRSLDADVQQDATFYVSFIFFFCSTLSMCVCSTLSMWLSHVREMTPIRMPRFMQFFPCYSHGFALDFSICVK